MDLRHRLRGKTSDLHASIEESFLFRQITQERITPAEYTLLIKKFYGFIKPCESLIHLRKHAHLINDREKMPLLDADLEFLEFSGISDTSIPLCKTLPNLVTLEDTLGYLYVIEGSTLGAQVITRMLQKKLGLTARTGGKFFYGYGHSTKIMWDKFCHQLNQVDDISQQNNIIVSACFTFYSLQTWLNELPLPTESTRKLSGEIVQ